MPAPPGSPHFPLCLRFPRPDGSSYLDAVSTALALVHPPSLPCTSALASPPPLSLPLSMPAPVVPLEPTPSAPPGWWSQILDLPSCATRPPKFPLRLRLSRLSARLLSPPPPWCAPVRDANSCGSGCAPVRAVAAASCCCVLAHVGFCPFDPLPPTSLPLPVCLPCGPSDIFPRSSGFSLVFCVTPLTAAYLLSAWLPLPPSLRVLSSHPYAHLTLPLT